MFALKPFTHEGRSLVRGEPFDLTPVEAAAMLRTGNADLIENRLETHNREMVAGPAPGRRARKRAVKTAGSRQKGGYRRRDITTKTAESKD